MNVGRDIGWLAIGQSAVRGAQLIAALVLVHLVPTNEWNILALALSVYLVAVTIGSLNLEHSVLTFLPVLDRKQYGRFLQQTRRFLVVTGTLTATAVVAMHSTIGLIQGTVPALLLAVSIMLEIPAAVGASVFIATNRHRAAGLWDLASAVTFMSAIFVPALLARTSTAVLVGLAIYGAARFAAFAVVVRTTHKDPTVPPIESLLRRQITFCAPLGISLAIGTLTRAVDKWIVAWNLPDSVGAYAVAAQELPILAVLPYAGGAAIAAGLVTLLNHGDRVAAHDLWKEQASKLCLPVVALSVGIASVAPEVFRLALPVDQRDAALSFAVFSFIGVHRVTEYGIVLRAANQNRHIIESAAVVLACCIIFGVIGARVGGLTGVSIGTACAFGAGWIAILRRIARVFDVPLTRVFPWTDWIRAINISVVAFVGALVMASLFESTIGRLLAKTATFVAIVRFLNHPKDEPTTRLVPA